jgi:hypothetical protein
MRTSVLYSALAAAVVVGIAACKGPDSLDSNLDSFSVVARGAFTIPQAADTTPVVTATLSTASGLTYANLTKSGGPAIDSIKIFQVGAATDLTPATGTAPVATAILCSGAAACAATSGTGTPRGTNTVASIRTSMRAYGSQLVVFSGANADGFARGTIYPVGD